MEFELLQDKSGYIVNTILARNDGDICIYEVVKELSSRKKYDCYVDVGADQGAWTFLVKYLSPTATVYSFEPNPESFQKLNLSTKDLGIHVFEVALSNSTGELQFTMGGANSNSRETDGTNTICVKKDLLQNYVNEPIDIIKIDTEGHDLHILESLTYALEANTIGTVITEWTTHWYGDFPEECLERSKSVLELYSKYFKHIYSLSRNGDPYLVKVEPVNFDTFLEEHLFKKLQTDICFTNETLTSLPIYPYEENIFYA